MIPTAQLQTFLDQGGTVVDEHGDKIGKVGQIYVDDYTDQPTWVTVKTGLFGTSETFVPLDRATIEGDDTLRVPYTKDLIKDAPRVDADQHLSPEEEEELYRYYGQDYTSAAAGRTGDVSDRPAGDVGDRLAGDITDRPAGDVGVAGTAVPGTTGTTAGDRDATRTSGDRDATRTAGDHDASVVRSEEQVDVGTRQREAGKARLRKHVVTDHVTKTVPVQREEVRVEREPVSGSATDRDLGSDEAEVTLHEEEVVVDKTAKPVERVSLDTETVTDQRTVDEEVRKEQVDVDTDETRR